MFSSDFRVLIDNFTDILSDFLETRNLNFDDEEDEDEDDGGGPGGDPGGGAGDTVDSCCCSRLYLPF